MLTFLYDDADDWISCRRTIENKFFSATADSSGIMRTYGIPVTMFIPDEIFR